MSRENLAQTLEAVETALTHLAASLEAGGFAAGASTYKKMAGVVLGQRLWAEGKGLTEFNDQYRRVGILATRVYEYLTPYVEVMEQLAILSGSPVSDEGLSELGAGLLAALKEAKGPLSVTRLRRLVGAGTTAVRRELEKLESAGRVRTVRSGGRTLFELAQ